MIKFVDKAGDLITVTSKNDLHVALTEVVAQYQRTLAAQGAHGPKLATPMPPIKLTLVPVASQVGRPWWGGRGAETVVGRQWGGGSGGEAVGRRARGLLEGYGRVAHWL